MVRHVRESKLTPLAIRALEEQERLFKGLSVAYVYKVELSAANPDKPWCCRWATPTMPAKSYWYFATETAANEARDKILDDGTSRMIGAYI